MLSFIRTLLYYLGDIPALMLMTIAVMLMFPFPVHARYQVAALWPKFSIWWLSVICGVKYEIQGFENIPDTPVIIMCKHSSTWGNHGNARIFPTAGLDCKKRTFLDTRIRLGIIHDQSNRYR